MQTQTSPRRPKSTRKVAQLRQLPNGTIQALGSKGDLYTVRIGTDASCECPGFTHYGHCYHLRTATQRFPGFWKLPAKPAPRRASVTDLYE